MLANRNISSFKVLRCTLPALTVLLCLAPVLRAGVELKGANGAVIDFLGVSEATEKGLHLMMDREQGEILVLWSVFDLEDMRQRQPEIHKAYEKLRSDGRPVSLKLGIYEKLQTRKQMSAELKKRLGETIQLTVPNMTNLFDLSGFDERYDRGNLNSVYSSWQRRSESYIRNYERLLTEFFTLEPNEANRSTWTYTVNGKVKYRVYTEAKPPQGIVKKRPLDFIAYFGDPEARETSLLATYLRNNPEILRKVTSILDDQSKSLADGLVIGEAHEIATLKATVDDSLTHLNGMIQKTALSSDLQRDIEKYLRTWELL